MAKLYTFQIEPCDEKTTCDCVAHQSIVFEASHIDDVHKAAQSYVENAKEAVPVNVCCLDKYAPFWFYEFYKTQPYST